MTNSTANQIIYVPKQEFLKLQAENDELRSKLHGLRETTDKLRYYQVANTVLVCKNKDSQDEIEKLKRENQELRDQIAKLEDTVVKLGDKVVKLEDQGAKRELRDQFEHLMSGLHDLNNLDKLQTSPTLEANTKVTLTTGLPPVRNDICHFINIRDHQTTKDLKYVALSKKLVSMNTQVRSRFDNLFGQAVMDDLIKYLRVKVSNTPALSCINDTNPDLQQYMDELDGNFF